MKTVEEIQVEIRGLSFKDKQKLLEFLDSLIEDRMEFTPEFEAQIRQSEKEMKEGRRNRRRSP